MTARSTVSTRHDEKAIAFFGTWALLGLYLDGWAHIHNKPETFFSPWHGVLYSGVGAAVAYYGFRDFVLRKESATSDRLLTAGFAIFMVGAVGDFVWHEIFGIEADIEALLSPTHLFLLTGGVFMLSFGVRAASQRAERDVSLREFFPTIMSLTLTAALVMFFTQYFAAHSFLGLYDDTGDRAELFQIHAIGSVFVTNGSSSVRRCSRCAGGTHRSVPSRSCMDSSRWASRAWTSSKPRCRHRPRRWRGWWWTCSRRGYARPSSAGVPLWSSRAWLR